jgi:hypothetical protein
MSENLPAIAGMAKLPISERASAAFGLPAGFAVVKHVTRTVLQQLDGVPFFITFEGPFKDGKELARGRGGGTIEKPARTADIINAVTGEIATLIANRVLESELTENYPNNGYVGKSFAILRKSHPDAFKEGKDGKMVENIDKRYKLYTITEIAPTTTETGAPYLKSAGNGVIDGTNAAAIERAKGKGKG